MEIMPCKEDAKTLAEEMGRPCLIPLVATEEGCKDPAKAYLGLREKYEPSYLLESLTGPKNSSRYSVIGALPLLNLKIRNGKREISGSPELVKEANLSLSEDNEETDSLEILRKSMLFDELHFVGLNVPRYILGVTGYISYDYVSSLFGIETSEANDLDHPTMEFMLPSIVIVFDHLKNVTYYASLLLLTREREFEEFHQEAKERLEEIFSEKMNYPTESERTVHLESNLEKEGFEEGVGKIKDYIREGEVIQTVLSRRIDLDPSPPLGDFYLKLREINPSPYMYFLDFQEQKVVGSSPESLVRVNDGKVMTRPIAGTRSRGKDYESDKAMETELLADEKERAEHVMLVDLGRNDIGKVSKFGSVETPEFMEIEKYGDVQHIVSTVTGDIKETCDAFDAFRAVFPAGTVTGAPKVRAMEIIQELEPTCRGIYSGAVGSFSYTGDADFAIAIRTLTSDGEEAHIQVGAGIVADSVPEKEYHETESKARSLLRAGGCIG